MKGSTAVKTFAFVLLVLLAVECNAKNSIKIDTETLHFIDQFNRTRLFHGQNVVVKEFPFYPELNVFNASNSFVEKDAQYLVEWGFNSIRLMMSWEGFEPVRQQYNFTYLEKIKEIIDLCAQYDIYVFLDAHQDLYSRFFCGEGMPNWTILNNTNHTFPAPFKNLNISRNDEGQPLMEDCLKVGFFEYYFTKDVSQQSNNLFTNEEGLADDFAAMWGQVAKYFSQFDEINNLLGYEIINEPFGVSPYKHPKDWVLSAGQNNKYLKPVYLKVASQIRQYDPKRIIFYETALFDFLGGGFDSNLGDPEYEALSYHVYCGVNNKQGDPASRLLCNILDTTFVEAKEKNIQSMRVGGILSEFGALTNSAKSAVELNYLLNKADHNLRSWSHWAYKGFGDITTQSNSDDEGLFFSDGSIQTNKVKHLSRPYAQAICSQGTNVTSVFNPLLVSYELEYISKDCGSAQTEIFLSEEFWFTSPVIVTGQNVKELAKIPNKPAGYYQVIPIHPGQKVHLKILNL